MAIEPDKRARILAGVAFLLAAGAGAWLLFLQDFLNRPPPAPKAAVAAVATPAKPAAGVPAPATDAPKAAAAAQSAGGTKELRPSSGKYYSNEELKGMLMSCVVAVFSKAERVTALCEEIVTLHEAGKEEEASKTMRKALDLMVASGLLNTEKEKDDPWQSDIPAKALALNKEGKELHFSAGAGKVSFDAPIEKFRQALAIKPDYYTATRNLAESLSFKGDQQGVEDNHRKALALAEKFNIRDMELYERFANFLSFRERRPEAKQILQKGLQLDPDNTRLLGALGAIYEQDKDFKSATTYYERAARGGSGYARERLEGLQKRKQEPNPAKG